MEPKYKVGDVVTIKKREGTSTDYSFCFVDAMAALSGKQFKVTKVSKDMFPPTRKFPDDGFRYHLNDPGDYNWASSMFEDSVDHPIKDSTVHTSLSISEDKSGDISPFIKKKSCPKLDFNL